jgi:hypothetical protein
MKAQEAKANIIDSIKRDLENLAEETMFSIQVIFFCSFWEVFW